jgi:hypothetical protein
MDTKYNTIESCKTGILSNTYNIPDIPLSNYLLKFSAVGLRINPMFIVGDYNGEKGKVNKGNK